MMVLEDMQSGELSKIIDELCESPDSLVPHIGCCTTDKRCGASYSSVSNCRSLGIAVSFLEVLD